MAAPSDVSLKDLSGKWVMNKDLSDDADPILALQGISWITRKAIAWATITLNVTQFTKAGVTHIDIDQTATGGIKGTREERTLDWDKRHHSDHLFGELEGQSRWTDGGREGWEEVDAYLKEGWLSEGEEGGPKGEKHVQSFVVNEKDSWTAEQIWGFVEIEGNRYYARRVIVTRGDTTLKVRFIYNYIGKDE